MNATNATSITQITTPLSLNTCHMTFLLAQIECSSYNQSECITCPVYGHFLAEDNVGRYICLFLWLLTCIIGAFGTVANLLIIKILKNQKQQRPFYIFLTGLAGFDAVCSISSILCLSGTAFYFQNWSKGIASWYAYHYGLMIVLIAHSGSSFTTVLITLERFLVVAFPIKCGDWFTPKRNRILVFLISIWALFLGIPRLTSFYIGKNSVGQQFPSLVDVNYFVVETHLAKLWYITAGAFFDLIDLWAPLPILLLFNLLVYYHVRKFEKRRTQLTSKHQKDLRAARMFLPVAIVLFLCNIGPIVHYAFVYGGNIYGEMYFLAIFSFAINSAVNLPIYYLKGSSFRREARNLFASYFPNILETTENGSKGPGTSNAV